MTAESSSPEESPTICSTEELEAHALHAVLFYRGDLTMWTWAFYVPDGSVTPVGSSGMLYHVINTSEFDMEWKFEAETKDVISSPLAVAIVKLSDVGFLGSYQDIVGEDGLLSMFKAVNIPRAGSDIHPAEFSTRTWFLDAVCVLHDCGVLGCEDVWLLEREIRRFAFAAMDKYLQNQGWSVYQSEQCS